jgi:hypothetical protein
MVDVTYQKFVQRWKLITDLPPQNVGPFTQLYKKITVHLKVMPWFLLMFGAVFVVGSLYFFFGSSFTRIVSLLQRGF